MDVLIILRSSKMISEERTSEAESMATLTVRIHKALPYEEMLRIAYLSLPSQEEWETISRSR